MTTFSFTRNESSSRWHPHRCQPYWRPPTWDMKGSNVCFTALEQILISRAPRRWFRNTSACARFASETNMSTSIQPACYNCCSYRPMDFVEGLPHVHNKSVILTVNDWFSNFSHFIPLGHSYTATSVVQAFFTEVVQIYLMPNSIVSNRDLVLTSTFWQELFRLAKAASLPGFSWGKLSPKFYGPYKLLAREGDVAYHLQLSTDTRIHDVFHVGVLKPFHGAPQVTNPSLPAINNGRVLPVPYKGYGYHITNSSRLNLGRTHHIPCPRRKQPADIRGVPDKERQPEFYMETTRTTRIVSILVFLVLLGQEDTYGYKYKTP
uniref:Polyprotein n=1 Tax=Oryza sativa subsp. japonica TaxID=39947 RepID=Q8LMU7_ORYSJ|nr:putative polyprotein [Oryza sativa Japonica Group]